MALTGQLSDMSLAELIEFFCNQRKTGRLKVDYHRGHGVFFIKDGELVDAKVGALSGAEAVYFALTLPNAAFEFSSDIEPPRRSIKDSWTQVVLEGLRRLDEGKSPSEADAFGGGWNPSEADMAIFMDHVERLGAAQEAKSSKETSDAAAAATASASAPMSMMVEGASGEAGGGKKKMVMVAVAASVVLACAVAAIPLAGRLGGTRRAPAAPASAVAAPAEATSPNTSADNGNASDASSSPEAATNGEATGTTDGAPAVDADGGAAAASAAALATRREARERLARERERRAEEAKKTEAAQKTADGVAPAAAAQPAPVAAATAASGPKTVRVSVAYDEAGRVTQASVAGTSPGAEAYGGTAVRSVRGRRFPVGKAGATVVTVRVQN
jgi:hypothetical protein